MIVLVLVGALHFCFYSESRFQDTGFLFWCLPKRVIRNQVVGGNFILFTLLAFRIHINVLLLVAVLLQKVKMVNIYKFGRLLYVVRRFC